jgi:hypothetical protein
MKLKVLFTVLFLMLAAVPAHAAKWICSTTAGEYSQADLDFTPGSEVGTLAAASKRAGAGARVKAQLKIDRLDVMQLYTGTPVIIGSTWLKGFVLSPTAPESVTAFVGLGLDPNTAVVAEKLARVSSLSEKGLRLVSSEQEVILGVANRHPSVGYVSNYLGGVPGVKDCFSN